jgi:hypothetical protein
VLVEDRLDHPLQEANTSFLRHDLPKAAGYIREAAVLLQAESDHAINETIKQTLVSSAQTLDALADAVQQGCTRDEADLKCTFAKIHDTLARHFYRQAQTSWLHNGTDNAGRALRRAADHVENGLRWVGYRARGGTTTVLSDVRQLDREDRKNKCTFQASRRHG